MSTLAEKKYTGDNENDLEIYVLNGVTGEETVQNINFTKFDTQVLVTKEKEYFNIYIIHEAFKTEPMNNLYCQKPIQYGIPTELQLYLYVIQYRLWFKYNKDFSISYEEIDV